MTFDIADWLRDNHYESTLLGVCPMSEEIVTATIRSAKTEGLLPMFIATPRQVDADRGYTGWSQTELVSYVDTTCEREGYDGPYALARDHGGPYQSTRDRNNPDISLKTAMKYATELFYEDLEAGFDVLHVDATEDPRIDGPLRLEEIADRTVELIDAIEARRKQDGHDPVYYEVGTEEISGGMTSPSDFERFLNMLENKLKTQREGVFDRVIFAVGQVGTTMRIDMTNEFEPKKASNLVDIAAERDIFLKVHFTDWLPTDQLKRFPEVGIGAANVGPEFAAASVKALEEFERQEQEIVAEADNASQREPSEFMSVLEDAAIRDAPWTKYAPADLDSNEYAAFASENARDIALCVGRYAFGDADVREARTQLYETLAECSSLEPEEHLVETIKESIDRYVRAFDARR